MEQVSEQQSVKTKTRFNVGLIGLGQGGSSMAQTVAKTITGFDLNHLVSINLSEADLRGAKLVPANNRILLDKNRFGAGKSRDVSKTYVMEYKDFIIEELGKRFGEDVNLYFVFYSLDGGTGSGMGPYLSALLESDEFHKSRNSIVFGVPILPDQNAGKLGLSNAIEALKEISNLSKNKVARFLLVDNNSIDEKESTVRWDKINSQVARALNRYLFKACSSSSSNLDFEDRFVALRVPGCHSFSNYQYKRSNDNEIRDIEMKSVFVLPEGARVDRIASEIPEEDSIILQKVTSIVGCTVDEPNMVGLYDRNDDETVSPILHFAGFSNLAKVTERYQHWFSQIKQKSEAAAKVDANGNGFDSIESNKGWIDSQSGTDTSKSAGDLFAMLGN